MFPICSTPTATLAPEPDDAEPYDWADEHVRMLRELAELGMQLARAVAAQALAEAQAGVAIEPGRADPGLSFSRVSRAVRLTLALEARIREGAFARQDPEPDDFAERMKEAAQRSKEKVMRMMRSLRESEGRRLVKDIAEGDETQAETLMAEFRERLAEEETFPALTRPVGEVIAQICRDLGAAPDWSRWSDEAWAAARADGASVTDGAGDKSLLPPWGSCPPSGGLRGTETRQPP